MDENLEKLVEKYCSDGDVDALKSLVKNKQIDWNQKINGWSPLMIACRKSQPGIVKFLLNEKTVDVNEDGMTPLYAACEEGHVEVVKLLLKHKKIEPNFYVRDMNPLHIACQKGKVEVVKLLLKEPKVLVNTTTFGDDSTPLYLACDNGKLDVVKVLISDKRVDINCARATAGTPLLISLRHGYSEITELIRQARKQRMDFNKEIKKSIVNLNAGVDLVQSIANIRDFLTEQETREFTIQENGLESLLQIFETSTDGNIKSLILRAFYNLSIHDQIMLHLEKINGFLRMPAVFIQSDMAIKNEIITIWRWFLGRNQKARVQAATKELFDCLLYFMKQTTATSLDAAGIILYLSGYLSDLEGVRYAMTSVLIPHMAYSKVGVLEILIDSSSIDSSRPILLEMGTSALVTPFIKSENSDTAFVSCLILALLSSSEKNESDTTGSNPTPPLVITKVLDTLNKFATTSANSIYPFDSTLEIDCFMILIAIRSLATNEANLKELINQGIVSSLVTFIVNRKDLLETSVLTIEKFAKCIWALSFDSICKQEFLAKGIVGLLKSLKVTDNLNASQAIDGALFTLAGRNPNQSLIESKGKGNQANHQIMISYSWAQKEKARNLAEHLKRKGFNIWIDVEQMEGSVLEKMAEAVEGSAVILIFLSSNYKESQACRTEAEYTYKLKKEVICIMAEDNYQPRGWLGALLGNKLFYDLWKNSETETLEDASVPIITLLQKLVTVSSTQSQAQIQDQIQAQIENENQKEIQPSQNSQPKGNDQILSLLEKISQRLDTMEQRFQTLENVVKEQSQNFENQMKEISIQIETLRVKE